MVTEKALDDLAANQALEKIGMKLGHWHRLEYLDERKQRDFYWDKFLASSEGDELNVRELSVLSQKVLDWLPDQGGYVVAFDDSTSLTSDQILILSRIFGGDIRSSSREAALSWCRFQAKVSKRNFGFPISFSSASYFVPISTS